MIFLKWAETRSQRLFIPWNFIFLEACSHLTHTKVFYASFFGYIMYVKWGNISNQAHTAIFYYIMTNVASGFPFILRQPLLIKISRYLSKLLFCLVNRKVFFVNYGENLISNTFTMSYEKTFLPCKFHLKGMHEKN